MSHDDISLNSLTKAKFTLAGVLVLLAGATGLMWPAVSQTDPVIKPVPVHTLSFREGDALVRLNEPGLPEWLRAEDAPGTPAWTVRADGLWVPWTMQPPAWLSAIAQGYVVAETVPVPPERPKDKTGPEMGGGEVLSFPKPPQKRMARDGGLCEKHGLRQVWTDKYRWRCQR